MNTQIQIIGDPEEIRRFIQEAVAGVVPKEQGRALTVKEAAERLSLSASTVRRLIENHELPAWNVGRKQHEYRISADVIEKRLSGG